MNLSTKHKQTHRTELGLLGCGWAVGGGRTGSLGLVDANYYI